MPLPLHLNIAQQNIPNSTAAPTHHVSISKNILFFKNFQNSFFSKMFWPFLGAPGAQAHRLRISLFPLHILKFFPTFLPHFFRLTFILPSSRYSTPLTLVQSPCSTEGPPILLVLIQRVLWVVLQSEVLYGHLVHRANTYVCIVCCVHFSCFL